MRSAETQRNAVWGRLIAVPSAKLRLLLGLTVGICVPYFSLQRITLFPERLVPELFLDRQIPFDPAWTPLYLSICLLVPVSVLLADRAAALRSFARGLAALCAVCFASFVLFPAVGPRPSGEMIAGLEGAYLWLVSVDGVRNAFPSLHAALTVFCMSFALRVLGARIPQRLAGWAWGTAILYGTLATKQHFALDVLAGAGLGALAYIWSRPLPPDPGGAESSQHGR